MFAGAAILADAGPRSTPALAGESIVCQSSIDGDIVLMLDRTPSMTAADRANERAAAKSLVGFFDDATPAPYVGIGAFGDNVVGSPEAFIVHGLTNSATPPPYGDNDGQNDGDIFAAIDTATGSNSQGGTNLSDAVNVGQNELTSRASAADYLILVSDGEATQPLPNPSQAALSSAAAAKAAGTEIFTIVVGSNSASSHSLLAGMATDSPHTHPADDAQENTDGDHFFIAPAADELRDIFLQISEEICPPAGPSLQVDTRAGDLIDPSRPVDPNETLQASLELRDLPTDTGLSSFDLELAYDGSQVELLSFQPGAFFTGRGIAYSCPQQSFGHGTARLQCAYDAPAPLPAPSSDGTLVTLTVHVLQTAGVGSVSLDITSATLRDAAADPYELITTGGVLGIAQVETVAGGGGGCDDSLPAGCPAIGASGLDLDGARGLSSGNSFYISDTLNHVVRKIDDGVSYRVAGGDGIAGLADGIRKNARLNEPSGLDIDAAGNLYVADACNHRIRRISPAGLVTTVAGSGPAGCGSGAYAGDGGSALGARLNTPRDVAVDRSGNLYIADTLNCAVRRVDANTSVITTVAGTGVCGFNGDGAALSVQLNLPEGVALEPFVDATRPAGIVVSDTGNDLIRRVAAGTVTTTAGGGLNPESCEGSINEIGDGCLATEAVLHEPRGLAVDASGRVFFADSDTNDAGTVNNRVRRIELDGRIQTVAGGGSGCGEPCPALEQALPTTSDVILADGVFAVTDEFVKHFFAAFDVQTGASPTRSPCASGGDNSGDTVLMFAPTLALAFLSVGGARRWRRRRRGEP